MLSRELLDIYKASMGAGGSAAAGLGLGNVLVDSQGDDVYTWVVDIYGFDPASDLAKVRQGQGAEVGAGAPKG